MSHDKSGYMPQLDALRAIAVAAVAYSHWMPNEYHFNLPLGAGGVQLFFVLSGFLITGILLKCREYPDRGQALKAFYARRFLRIFPLFYGALLVGALLNVQPVRETILWHVSYLSNIYLFIRQDWDGPISHFWSLAVEEQFYLVWPAVILLVPRRALPGVILLTLVIGFASRYALPLARPDLKLVKVLPTSALVALGLGAALACSRQGVIALKFRSALVVALPVYLVLFVLERAGVFYLPPGVAFLQDFALMLGFTWLVDRTALGFDGMVGRVLGIPLLIYLGKISYGLYVIHNFADIPVTAFTKQIGLPDLKFGIPGFALKTVFTLTVSIASWHFFEAPINRMKDRYPYRKRERAEAPDATPGESAGPVLSS